MSITATTLLPRNGILPVSASTGLQFSSGEIGSYALGAAIAITVLTSLIVGLRWYTRAYLARCVGFDEFIILIAMVLAWTMCIILGLEYDAGIGSYNNKDVDAVQLTKLIVTNNVIWALATAATKASIIAQYLRIFSSFTLRYICIFVLFVLFLNTCFAVFGGIFLCQPTEKLWLPDLPGRCMDALEYWISVAIINTGLDAVIWSLPMPLLFSLMLPRREKICIVSLFLLGFLVVVISVVRASTVYVKHEKGDAVMAGLYAILWSVIEVNIGIMCASFIAFKPLLTAWFPRLLQRDRIPEPRFFDIGAVTWHPTERDIEEIERAIFLALNHPRNSLPLDFEAAMFPGSSVMSEYGSSDRDPLEDAGIEICDFALTTSKSCKSDRSAKTV